MTQQINPLYNAIVFGTLMSAVDRIGISLPIVARQTAELLAPRLEDLIKMVSENEKVPESLNELIELAKGLSERDKVVEKVEASISGSSINTKVTGCMYLDTANFGKILGYKACPICVAALMMSAAISAAKFGSVSEAKFENNGNECHVSLTLLDNF